MSTERDVAYLLRSWFRTEPDGSVDHVIDAILSEVDTTRQRRSTWWPARRSLDMNTMMKFGIAAAVLAVTVALGYGLWQNIGNVTPAPDASEAPDAGDAGFPQEFDYVFITATRDVPGIEVDDKLVMDLTSEVFRLYTDLAITPRLTSAPSVTADGQLRLETVAEGTGCEPGDVGTFDYSFSPGGTVLTVASGQDDCESRAAAVPGEWHRSACRAVDNWCLGVLESGTQSSLFFDPFAEEWGEPITRHGAMAYQVPDGWANADDRTHFYTLVRADAYDEDYVDDCRDCPDALWIGASPQATTLDCSEDPDAAVGTSAEALAEWLRGHPGLEVTDGPAAEVDGRPTIVLDVAGSESYVDSCLDPSHDVTHIPLFTHPGYTLGIRTGDRHRVMVVEIDADTAMVIDIDSLDQADLPALVAETQPIIDSMRLTAP